MPPWPTGGPSTRPKLGAALSCAWKGLLLLLLVWSGTSLLCFSWSHSLIKIKNPSTVLVLSEMYFMTLRWGLGWEEDYNWKKFMTLWSIWRCQRQGGQSDMRFGGCFSQLPLWHMAVPSHVRPAPVPLPPAHQAGSHHLLPTFPLGFFLVSPSLHPAAASAPCKFLLPPRSCFS